MITGEKISLRLPEMTDLETIYRWENDPDLNVISDYLHPVSVFSIEQYIINCNHDPFITGQLRLLAQTLVAGDVVGHVDLFDVDPVHRRAGIGILVEAPMREKGYAAQMLELIEMYCMNTLGLNQLWCHIVLPNQASEKLFEKAGFHASGIKKSWIRRNGSSRDVAFYQKIF